MSTRKAVKDQLPVMRIAYLECFSGISGDMLLGALADAGAPAGELAGVPQKLGLEGASLRFSKTVRCHVSATYAKVDEAQADQAQVDQNDAHSHHHHPHRSLSAIEKMIGAAPLSERTRREAIAVFRRLGQAEARIHNLPIEQVHFHEVGAVDSLIDIVGACAGLELLGIDQLYCSPLNVGGGTAATEHGTLPAPAPATVDLLKSVGAPIYSSGAQMELVTPTGAAVVATLAASFGAMPPMRLVASGYGAGTKDLPGRPNVLRILVGEAAELSAGAPLESAAPHATVCVIEANVDDMNPQIAGHLTEQALAAGALDIYFTPAQMKKNRPGMVVSLVVDMKDRERLCRLLFRESTTIGVRMYTAERRTLERAHVPVTTAYGPLRIKVSRLNGEVLNFAPEYEDCAKAARERDVPLKRVLAEASARYLEQFGKTD